MKVLHVMLLSCDFLLCFVLLFVFLTYSFDIVSLHCIFFHILTITYYREGSALLMFGVLNGSCV